MDDLSDVAKAFLARAQRSHDVPEGDVKQRVRAAVTATLGAGALGAASMPAAAPVSAPASELLHTAKRWSLRSKLWSAAGLAALVGVGTIVLTRSAAPALPVELPSAHTAPVSADLAPSITSAPQPLEHAQPSLPQAHEPAIEAPAPVADVPSAQPAPQLGKSAPNRRSGSASAAVDRREVALLMSASEALDDDDAARGLRLLGQHRSTYRRSVLAQERRGLFVVAHCLQDRARARREAEAFLAQFPSAVLTTRIRHACQL